MIPTPLNPNRFDQDVFSPATLAADALDGMVSSDPAQRFADQCHQHHRQAAQHRSVRLRTIEQIRRPAKPA